MANLVLIHAFPLSAAMWKAQIDSLESAGHRVCAPDLPGFGSEPLCFQASIDGYAQFVLAKMDQAEMHSAVVCGLSMGGYVALRLCAQASARVRRLVLADTRAAADSPQAKSGRLQNVASIQKHGRAQFVEDLLPKLLSSSASNELLAGVREMMLSATDAAVVAALHAMAQRHDSTDILANIGVPCSLVVGEEDRLTPPEEMQRLCDILSTAQLETLPLAGHLSNLEAPDAFNQVLLRHLAMV